MLTARSVTSRQRKYFVSLIIVIMTGLGSRMIHTGVAVVDKYLGDALYAVMIYLILSIFRNEVPPLRRAVVAMIFMTALEVFQLTLIPLEMTKSGSIMNRIVGRLLGTTFSWLDLAAYVVGIATVCLGDFCWFSLIREE